MPKRPRPSRATTLFFSFAAVAVMSTVVSLVRAGIGEHAHARFASEKVRVDARCAERTTAARALEAPSSDPWCSRASGSMPMFQEYRLGREALDAAKSVTASDADRTAALVRVLDHAGRVDRHDTPMSSLAASRLVDGAVDVLESNRRFFADAGVARALERTRLDSAKRPFDTQRHLWDAELGAMPGRGRLPDSSLARAAAGAAMLGLDDVFGVMQTHVLAGDVAGCRRVAETSGAVGRMFVGGGGVCTNAASVVRAGRRLDAVRTAASASAAHRLRVTGSGRPMP